MLFYVYLAAIVKSYNRFLTLLPNSAVKFMVQNYRLSDSIVGASSFLGGSSSMRAIDAGQMAVANLQTILEYFDTSDIENIKVG